MFRLKLVAAAIINPRVLIRQKNCVRDMSLLHSPRETLQIPNPKRMIEIERWENGAEVAPYLENKPAHVVGS